MLVCVFFSYFFFFFFVLLIQWFGIIFHKKMNRICWLHAGVCMKMPRVWEAVQLNIWQERERETSRMGNIIHDLHMCSHWVKNVFTFSKCIEIFGFELMCSSRACEHYGSHPPNPKCHISQMRWIIFTRLSQWPQFSMFFFVFFSVFRSVLFFFVLHLHLFLFDFHFPEIVTAVTETKSNNIPCDECLWPEIQFNRVEERKEKKNISAGMDNVKMLWNIC